MGEREPVHWYCTSNKSGTEEEKEEKEETQETELNVRWCSTRKQSDRSPASRMELM
jgi:hypothetical protein